MNKVYYIFYFILIAVYSCSSDFAHSDRISYFLNERNIYLEQEAIIITITGTCGSCDRQTTDLLNELSKIDNYDLILKIIIISDRQIETISKTENNEFIIISESDYVLGRYGINFDKNLLIHYSKTEKIKYWKWLYMENFHDIRDYYNLKHV